MRESHVKFVVENLIMIESKLIYELVKKLIQKKLINKLNKIIKIKKL
jgi:hypothetical protein